MLAYKSCKEYRKNPHEFDAGVRYIGLLCSFIYSPTNWESCIQQLPSATISYISYSRLHSTTLSYISSLHAITGIWG